MNKARFYLNKVKKETPTVTLLYLLIGFAFGYMLGDWLFPERSYPGFYAVSTPVIRFSPAKHNPQKQSCTDFIIKKIQKAKHTIRIYMFVLNSKPIGQALWEAQQRGVDVKIILDNKQAGKSWEFFQHKLYKKQPPWVDKRKGEGHNKYMVIDGQTVITGSFNYSKNAEKNNRENISCFQSPAMAKSFEENWTTHQQADRVMPYSPQKKHK